MTNQQCIEAVSDISDYLCKINNICLGNEKSKFFFRGEGAYNEERTNKPKIFLDGRIKNEDKIIREAILKFPEIYTSGMSTFQKLVRMRHYELAVRLLDVSLSPLVALFFACSDSIPNKDGHVYIFKRRKEHIKYYDSDTVVLLSNIAYMKPDFDVHRKHELLHKIKEERPDFYDFFGNNLQNLNKTICVIPQYNNARMIVQQGAFFLFGLSKGKKQVYGIKPDYDIIIPYGNKKMIKEQLDLLGINGMTLFPEEDKVFIELNKKYSNPNTK